MWSLRDIIHSEAVNMDRWYAGLTPYLDVHSEDFHRHLNFWFPEGIPIEKQTSVCEHEGNEGEDNAK